jgi:hypothetical protein
MTLMATWHKQDAAAFMSQARQFAAWTPKRIKKAIERKLYETHGLCIGCGGLMMIEAIYPPQCSACEQEQFEVWAGMN